VPISIIIALVLLNGVFVAAEFAIVGASRAEIEQAVRRGSRVAGRVKRILENPREQDRFIATAQLGITAASLGLGMYGEHVIAHWIAGLLEGWGVGRWIAAHTLATILSVAILTYLHIVVGEMVPKALALQHAGPTALRVTPPMQTFQLIGYPLVLALNGIGNGLLRLAGIDRAAGSTEAYRTPEEIAFIVRESRAGGLLRSQAANVLEELLELGELTAADVMLPRVHVTGIPADASDDDVAELFRSAPHARYPVYEDNLDRIVGMVHVKDLLRSRVRGEPFGDVPRRPVAFLPLNASADDILAAMRQTRSQLVVVMDEHGGTAGIITLEDLFEEVVGEVTDDRTEPPEVYTDDAGRLRVQGTARIDEAAAALGVVLEFDAADTVSGLVLALLKRPPRIGDRVEWEEAVFEITAIHGNGVDECIVSRRP
jgi:CBS domain containing-hemolysin-like protein